MRHLKETVGLLLVLLTAFSAMTTVHAAVPVRISVKFILDANGDRPLAGNLNTDEEIQAEIDEAVSILSTTFTEFEVDTIQYVDLPGVSQWYSTSVADPNGGTNRDNLRAAAMADPTTYLWKTDAINIYINGGSSSAIGAFPPDNDIILMNQWCTNTPSCVLHEIGHNLSLAHTHETCCTNGDFCADTLLDNQSWTKDQVSSNNFGVTYANLTASQQDQVDITFNNVMSYHVGEAQRRLSACQMDRISAQGYTDLSWLLTKTPVYVDESATSATENGSFATPYKQMQSALTAGGLNNKVLVLEQSTHTITQSAINTNVEIVTRTGLSRVDRGLQRYQLPVDLENSKNTKVQIAVKAARTEDTKARKNMREARDKANGVSEERAQSIMAAAKEKNKLHKDNALKQILSAEKVAAGDEKIAIQLELAQRYRYSGNYKLAARFYKLVAEATDQPALEEEALYLNKKFQKKSDSEQNKVTVEEKSLPEEKQ